MMDKALASQHARRSQGVLATLIRESGYGAFTCVAMVMSFVAILFSVVLTGQLVIACGALMLIVLVTYDILKFFAAHGDDIVSNDTDSTASCNDTVSANDHDRGVNVNADGPDMVSDDDDGVPLEGRIQWLYCSSGSHCFHKNPDCEKLERFRKHPEESVAVVPDMSASIPVRMRCPTCFRACW